jgi:hypothetical protein
MAPSAMLPLPKSPLGRPLLGGIGPTGSSPGRRGEREPSFRRGLALMGIIALAGLAISFLTGSPAPSEQLTTLEQSP